MKIGLFTNLKHRNKSPDSKKVTIFFLIFHPSIFEDVPQSYKWLAIDKQIEQIALWIMLTQSTYKEFLHTWYTIRSLPGKSLLPHFHLNVTVLASKLFSWLI